MRQYAREVYVMQVLTVDGVEIQGIYSCLPARSEDNLMRCREIYGDEKKAVSIVKATGIKSRRVVEEGVSSLDLCVQAARALMKDASVAKEDVGAVISVTFTPERTMPCNACQAQRQLGLPKDIAAFDINLACSGWAYGLFVASTFAKATGKRVLLLDGDTQSTHMNPSDIATVPVMADAGTATLLAPEGGKTTKWKFAFLTDGAKGDALVLPFGGTISMDGLGIFKFVTMDVLHFILDFMNEVGVKAESLAAFVPHQANIFMIRQIAKKLKFTEDQLWISGDVLGNSSSATVPTTLAYLAQVKALQGRNGSVLVSGFGGGLSASVGLIDFVENCLFKVMDYGA